MTFPTILAVEGEFAGRLGGVCHGPYHLVTVSLAALAHRFRATSATCAAIRRAICACYPIVANLVRPISGIRSESERYWEMGILAWGVAKLVSEDFLREQL